MFLIIVTAGRRRLGQDIEISTPKCTSKIFTKMLSDSGSAEPRHWECAHCTFINQNYFSKFCEVCTCRRSVPSFGERKTAEDRELGIRLDQVNRVNTDTHASLGSTNTAEKVVESETGELGASTQPKTGVSACSFVCEASIPTGGTPARDTAADRRAKLSLRKRNGPSPSFVERSRPPRASWEQFTKTNLPQAVRELPQEQEELPSQPECTPAANSKEAAMDSNSHVHENVDNISRPEVLLAFESGSHVPRFDLHDSCSDGSDSSDDSDDSDGVSDTSDREGENKDNIPSPNLLSVHDSQLLQNPLQTHSQIQSVGQQKRQQQQTAAESNGRDLPTRIESKRQQSDGRSDTLSEESSSQNLLDPHPFLQRQKYSPARDVDWECAMCTLLNSAEVDTCAACDHQRGKASDSRSVINKFSVAAWSETNQDLSHNFSSDSSDCGLNDMPFSRGDKSTGFDRECDYNTNQRSDSELDEDDDGVGGSARGCTGQSSGRHDLDSDNDGENIEILDSEDEELDTNRRHCREGDTQEGESDVVDLSNVDTLAALLSQVPATASKRKSFGLSSETFAPRKGAQVEEIIDSSEEEEEEDENPEIQSGAFPTLPHFVSVSWLERQRGGPRVDFRSMVVNRASVARDLKELQKAAAKKAALPPSARSRGATKGKGKKAKRRKKGSKRPRTSKNDAGSRVTSSRAPRTTAVPGSGAQFTVAQRRPAVPPVPPPAVTAPAQQPKSRTLPNAFANFLPVNRPPSGFAVGDAPRGAANRTASSSSRTYPASHISSSSLLSSSSSSSRSTPSRRPNYYASDTPDAPGCPGLTTTTWEGQGSITFE